MELKIKNKHIFFAVETIWSTLDYKFKYHLNQIVTANSEEEFEQSVDIPEPIVVQIYQELTKKPEGISNSINLEVKETLLSQILPVSNFTPEMALEELNEAGRILAAIQQITQQNLVTLQNKIISGKTQILL